MPFSARNARYLRISAHTVLPLYIYLDDKHIEWMSDYILQRVLADLKPNIGPKLRTESSMYGGSGANSKKGSVDVHRGDTYQFAYFFRRNEPHAVLIKSRKFVPAPVAPVAVPVAAPVIDDVPSAKKKQKRGKEARGGRGKGSRSRQKSPSESEEDAVMEELQQDDNPTGLVEGETPRRSGRKKLLIAGGYNDAEVHEENRVVMTGFEPSADDSYAPEDNNIDDMETPVQSNQQSHSEDIEAPASESGPQSSHMFGIDPDEEEKPKMALRVSYQGFTIYDRCLCVVVEPWPPLRDTSRAPSRALSLTLSEMRMSSIAPMHERGQTPVPLRERTPLFLPELDPRRSFTPAPLPSRILPPVPLFDDPTEPQDEGEENEDGMLVFSQALNSLGDERAGSADEDENEGDVFLGDADERRGDR